MLLRNTSTYLVQNGAACEGLDIRRGRLDDGAYDWRLVESIIKRGFGLADEVEDNRDDEDLKASEDVHQFCEGGLVKWSAYRPRSINVSGLTWAAAAMTERKTLTVASRECVAYEFVAYVCPQVRRCGRKRWID